MNIEVIRFDGVEYAIILRSAECQPGITFITPDEYSQQLAIMSHPTGKQIMPHRHNPVSREVVYTQEVLILRKGSLRVNFYDDSDKFLESRVLTAGDVILLAHGGHGFEVLEEIEMIEVKQGPYSGDHDKTRFEGIKN